MFSRSKARLLGFRYMLQMLWAPQPFIPIYLYIPCNSHFSLAYTLMLSAVKSHGIKKKKSIKEASIPGSLFIYILTRKATEPFIDSFIILST